MEETDRAKAVADKIKAIGDMVDAFKRDCPEVPMVFVAARTAENMTSAWGGHPTLALGLMSIMEGLILEPIVRAIMAQNQRRVVPAVDLPPGVVPIKR